MSYSWVDAVTKVLIRVARFSTFYVPNLDFQFLFVFIQEVVKKRPGGASLGRLLGRLQGVSMKTWASLCVSMKTWVVLGRHLGHLWGVLGVSLGRLCASLQRLGVSLRASLGVFGRLRASFLSGRLLTTPCTYLIYPIYMTNMSLDRL